GLALSLRSHAAHRIIALGDGDGRLGRPPPVHADPQHDQEDQPAGDSASTLHVPNSIIPPWPRETCCRTPRVVAPSAARPRPSWTKPAAPPALSMRTSPGSRPP